MVRVPETVPLDAASLTTIGAIALQGLRQGQIAFGETVAIIGAGLVGVLAIQLAKAAGCRVIAIDRDPQRVAFAAQFGASLAVNSDDPRAIEIIRNESRHGVDAAIITAATKSADPVEFAAAIARDRARLVVVGDVGMGVSRRNMYGKELTLTMSRSYGPGRYDPAYEEDGVDYPIGYVRWTERRNMEAFLQALETGAIDVRRLLENRFLVEHADQAYTAVTSGGAYTGILEYPDALSARPPKESKPAVTRVQRRERGASHRVHRGGRFRARNHYPRIAASQRSCAGFESLPDLASLPSRLGDCFDSSTRALLRKSSAIPKSLLSSSFRGMTVTGPTWLKRSQTASRFSLRSRSR